MKRPLPKQYGKGMVPSGTAGAVALCCFIQESDIKNGEGVTYTHLGNKGEDFCFFKFRWIDFKNQGERLRGDI